MPRVLRRKKFRRPQICAGHIEELVCGDGWSLPCFSSDVNPNYAPLEGQTEAEREQTIENMIAAWESSMELRATVQQRAVEKYGAHAKPWIEFVADDGLSREQALEQMALQRGCTIWKPEFSARAVIPAESTGERALGTRPTQAARVSKN